MRCRALLRTDYNFRRRTWNSTNRLRSFAKWPRLVRQLDDQSYTWHGSQGHRPPSHPEAQRDRTASRRTPAIYIPRDSSSTYWNVIFFYPSALQIATRKTIFCIQYRMALWILGHAHSLFFVPTTWQSRCHALSKVRGRVKDHRWCSPIRIIHYHSPVCFLPWRAHQQR